jgi:calcium-dependent protein kinase
MAMAFVKKLMTPNPHMRISIQEALNDPWIVKNAKIATPSPAAVLKSLGELKLFKAHSSIHKAVLAYMVGHTLSRDKERELREVFKMMDKNNDGQLSKEELMQAYMQAFNGDAECADKEVDRLMRTVDLNKNGMIEYNGTSSHHRIEFLMGHIKRKKALDREKLRLAFDHFDAVDAITEA